MPNPQGYPFYGEQDNSLFSKSVTYVLSQEEYNRYGVQSVTATVVFVHTPMSVDLQATVNVPTAIQKTAPITSFSITGNVVTIIAANNFSPGDVVTISGLSVGTYLNGQSLTVVNPTGTQFTAAFTHANVGSTSDSGTAKQAQATLTPQNVTYGTSQRNWCEPLVASGTYPAILPKGSPW